MKLDSFVCEKCGECCKHIDKVPELVHLQTKGICKYLKNNICSIYENRPDLCNRYKLFERLKTRMTEDEFVEKLVYFCKMIKNKKVAYDKA